MNKSPFLPLLLVAPLLVSANTAFAGRIPRLRPMKPIAQPIRVPSVPRTPVVKGNRLPAIPAVRLPALVDATHVSLLSLRLKPLLSPRVTPRIIPPNLMLPPKPVRDAVFTLQARPDSHGKGSAFAVLIDGKAWGVTARHVLDDVGRSPYISIQPHGKKPLFFQVNSAAEGNVNGADVAVFRLPEEVLPYIKPLPSSFSLPKVNSYAQSAGFSRGNFGWHPAVEILFASKHRILARYEDMPILSGYCGSPFIVNGKVVGVFVGKKIASEFIHADWFFMLSKYTRNPSIPSFAQVVPLDWVRMLVHKAEHQPVQNIKLYLQKHKIAELAPDEFIRTIYVLGNNNILQTVSAYPFMDYKHLEYFLRLDGADRVRLIVQKGDRFTARPKELVYEFKLK